MQKDLGKIFYEIKLNFLVSLVCVCLSDEICIALFNLFLPGCTTTRRKILGFLVNSYKVLVTI